MNRKENSLSPAPEFENVSVIWVNSYIRQTEKALELIEKKVKELGHVAPSHVKYEKLAILQQLGADLHASLVELEKIKPLAEQCFWVDERVRSVHVKQLEAINKVRNNPITHIHRGLFSNLLDAIVRLITVGDKYLSTNSDKLMNQVEKEVNDGSSGVAFCGKPVMDR